MKLELNVNRFANEDVIATSACGKEQVTVNFTADSIPGAGTLYTTSLPTTDSGKYISNDGATYKLVNKWDNRLYTCDNSNNYAAVSSQATIGATATKWSGVYHLNGSTYEFCVDGCNAK